MRVEEEDEAEEAEEDIPLVRESGAIDELSASNALTSSTIYKDNDNRERRSETQHSHIHT